MKKLIAILLSLQSIFLVSALDVVTLTNGTIIEGEITHKDSDGSLLINLPDGNKRYIMAYEIATVTTNDMPFNQAVEVSKQKQESKHDLKVSVYAGYNQFFSVSDKEMGQVVKPSPGFTIGAAFMYYPDKHKRLFLNPAIEIIGYWRKYNVYNMLGDDGKYYTNLIHGCFRWCYDLDNMPTGDKVEMKLQLPLCVGIDVIRNNFTSLSVLTGPIIAMDYIRDCGLAKSWSYSTFERVETGKHWNNWSQEWEKGTYPVYDTQIVGRWRVDWRFGLQFNHKHFMAGVNFDLGICNFRVWDSSDRNVLPNSAQIVVGYTF